MARSALCNAVLTLAFAAAPPACGKVPAVGSFEEYMAAHAALNDALINRIGTILSKPDRLDLLSLAHHPNDVTPERDFHGYGVLGRARIEDRDEQRQLVGAFYQSAREGNGEMMCFMPHHGLHAERDGEQVDIAICFHCLLYQVFDGQERPFAELSTLGWPVYERAVLDHHLALERHRY